MKSFGRNGAPPAKPYLRGYWRECVICSPQDRADRVRWYCNIMLGLGLVGTRAAEPYARHCYSPRPLATREPR